MWKMPITVIADGQTFTDVIQIEATQAEIAPQNNYRCFEITGWHLYRLCGDHKWFPKTVNLECPEAK